MIDITKKIVNSFVPLACSGYISAGKIGKEFYDKNKKVDFTFVGFTIDIASSYILYDSFNKICFGQYVKGALEGLVVIGFRVLMYSSLKDMEKNNKIY